MIENWFKSAQSILVAVVCFAIVSDSIAQFREDFTENSISLDSTAYIGWNTIIGDGFATMQLLQRNGFASIEVDATEDQMNLWWAVIARRVSERFDLSRLAQPKYELRIETRIRTSHAPRRVNLHLNTQRTTDYHSHLMEFDIPDTNNWHTISMTTENFDAQPGDIVYGQLALMDWGLEKYRVDVDYYKVDIVHIDSVGKDLGNPLPYRPPIPPLNTFKQHISVMYDAMIDSKYPDENFNNWHINNAGDKISLLTTNSTQYIIMRWDFSDFANKQPSGSGLLELTTFSVQRTSDKRKDFGMVRISEILAGDPDWVQTEVTYNTFCQAQSLNRVINTQMIIDIDVLEGKDSKNLITISQPVLKRLVEGKTLGLAICPLGPINASFYAMDNEDINFSAKLHFNID